MSDWSTSTVSHCQPKLSTKSIKRDAPFPTDKRAEERAEERADERAEKRGPTKRNLREQTNRENEAGRQEENLESEELLATAEHLQTLVSIFCFDNTNKDPAPRQSVTSPS